MTSRSSISSISSTALPFPRTGFTIVVLILLFVEAGAARFRLMDDRLVSETLGV